jgi:endonuclease III
VESLKRPEIYLEPKERAAKIFQLLTKEHPDAKIALNFSNPLELLIATILSAQCTDERVNIVTQTLFKKYTSPKDYAEADIADLEQDIRSTGFYHNKAKSIQKTSQILIDKFHSQVPKTMPEMLELAGVARKTANVVLYGSYGFVEGVAVDTHVRRLSQRLGLVECDDPVKIEQDLMNLLPREQWMKMADVLVFHGRRVCMAKKPNCSGCVLNKICPSAFTFS